MVPEPCEEFLLHDESRILGLLLGKISPYFQTRQAWLDWLGRYLSPDASRELFRKVAYLSDAGIAVMLKVLSALAERECLTATTLVRSTEVFPTRNTDWARTLCDSVLRPPYPYRSRSRLRCPGQLLQRALLGMANFLMVLHQNVHDSENAELMQLRKVVSLIRRRRPYLSAVPPHSWDKRIVRALRMSAQTGEERKSIEEMIRINQFWQGRFCAENAERLAELLVKVSERCIEGQLANSDNAFELLWILAIADAATRVRTSDNTQNSPEWSIVADFQIKDTAKHPGIRLAHRDGNLYCHISKDPPGAYEFEKSGVDGFQAVPNLYRQSLTSMGLNSDREFQPDIVLRFSRQETGATDYFVLADAKRNTSKNPHNYIRASVQKAILYLEVFKDLPGICSGDRHPHSPFGVTLLFYQPAPKVLDIPHSARRDIVDKLNQICIDGNQVPTPILSLDMSCVIDKERPREEDVLAAWFNCVSRGGRLLAGLMPAYSEMH